VKLYDSLFRTKRSREAVLSIDDRHRDKNGEIGKKHGNALVGTLRKIYGPTFAAGQPDTAKLADVLVQLNETSLSQLVHDHRNGKLEKKVRQAAS
jgi:DNA replication initiation complex subunit (GINS family)